MEAEEQIVTSKRKPSNRIQIRHIPKNATKDDVSDLVKNHGEIMKIDIVHTRSMENLAFVDYQSSEQAQEAIEKLDSFEFQGSVLKVDFAQNNGRHNRSRPRSSGGNRGSGYPLRILVPSDFVGAIIGKKGATIRRITTECKARVDVQGKGNSNLLEKNLFQVISIFGQPENCSNACRQILEVMQEEASATSRQEVPLKILADDRFCGRIIGREGKIIKKLREDTDSKISVSNTYTFVYRHEMPSIYPDRIITVRGAPDKVCEAENAISLRLREAFEKDIPQPPVPPYMVRQNTADPSRGGVGMHLPYAVVYPGFNNLSSYHAGDDYGRPSHNSAQSGPDTNGDILIMVPNSSVGALIGTGGSHIKLIIRDTNAFVTIGPKRDDDPNPAAERVVTIKGTLDAKWKASYMIFNKLTKEGYSGHDDMRLRTAMRVPRAMVGRVIGKQGNRVRELQRSTGAMIKIPEDPQAQGEEVLVEILGNFMQTSMAQTRIRSLCAAPVAPPPPGSVNGSHAASHSPIPASVPPMVPAPPQAHMMPPR